MCNRARAPTVAAMSLRTTSLLPVLGALAALAAAAPAAHADGSLTYAKDGNVFLSAPDGSGATQLTRDGGYAWPSQADDGTVVAVRQTEENGRKPRRLHRMDRSGTPLNPPVETVPVDNSFYIGPLAPKVSPDGALVAYHYFYTGPISDSTLPRTSISHADRNTVNGEITSTLGSYFTPSWLQDGRLLAFYAAERTYQVDIWNRDDTVTNWFADPEVAPLLTDGEVSRDGTRMAALGNGGLRLYELDGPPPAQPRLRCVITGFTGEVHDPTWSPDGRALAWEEGDGIHVAQLPDLSACAGAARPLVVPGGTDPDWGVAGPPAAAASPGGSTTATPRTSPPTARPKGKGPKVTLAKVPRSLRLAALRRGVSVRVTCGSACSLSAALVQKGRTLGTARARGKARRAVTVKVRPSRKQRSRLRTGRATLRVVATAGGRRTTVTRTITVKR
jgi:hypothetical protein